MYAHIYCAQRVAPEVCEGMYMERKRETEGETEGETESEQHNGARDLISRTTHIFYLYLTDTL